MKYLIVGDMHFGDRERQHFLDAAYLARTLADMPAVFIGGDLIEMKTVPFAPPRSCRERKRGCR